jgi:hypothetical protein
MYEEAPTLLHDAGYSQMMQTLDKNGYMMNNSSHRNTSSAGTHQGESPAANQTGQLPLALQSRCAGFDKLILNIIKHAEEIKKMQVRAEH